MVELRQQFRDEAEWQSFLSQHGNFGEQRTSILRDVTSRGLYEPLAEYQRRPEEITINETQLLESLTADYLNSRKGALLLQLKVVLETISKGDNSSVRIASTEGHSRTAEIVRMLCPHFHFVNWQNTEDRADGSSSKSVDGTCILGLVDVFLAGETFYRNRNDARELKYALEMLKPGGLLLMHTPVMVPRAPSVTGEHGSNTMKPSLAGHVQFAKSVPDWPLLRKFKELGCSDVYFSLFASSHYGIVATHEPGPIILTAQKRGGLHVERSASVNVLYDLPQGLCILVGLPRSGTTLLTSLFAVHSRTVASYEPWNSNRLEAKLTTANIQALAASEKLPPLSGKLLFIKETAVRTEYIRAAQELYNQTPDSVHKTTILLVREMEHTLLSEVEKRNEWWGDNVILDERFVETWARNRGQSLLILFEFVMQTRGVVVAFESLCADPDRILAKLTATVGISLEPRQLQYERYIHTKDVRGDLNVSRAPQPIDLGRAHLRDSQVSALRQLIERTAAQPWFKAFERIHNYLVEAGGIVAGDELPPTLLDQIRL